MKKSNLYQYGFSSILFSVVLLVSACWVYGPKKIFNGTEIYYNSNITEDEVDRLGQFLIDEEFSDGEEKTIQLNKSGNTYEFRMVVKKGIEQDQEYRNMGKELAMLISQYVFNGANVDVHYCDDYLKTLVVLPMADYSDYAADESYVKESNIKDTNTQESGFQATHRVRTNDGTKLRLRNTPSLYGTQITSLDYGSYVEIMEIGDSGVDPDGYYGNWVYVVTPDGILGWCFNAYLEEID